MVVLTMPPPEGAPRVLLTFEAPPAALAPLEALGARIARLPRAQQTEDGLCAAIGDVHALLCHPWIPVTERVAAASTALRVVSTVAVGYDNIDVAAFARRGIPVGHTPGVVVESTADLTYGLIIAVMRRVLAGDRFVRAGGWAHGLDAFGNDLYGKRLGILGMGAIGTAVARRALASGMEIAYTNRTPKTGLPFAAAFVSLAELFATADCLCVLAPLTDETRGIVDAAALRTMKRGAYLVNAARGGLVDTQALYDALASSHLAGAAVDVLDPEPIGPDHPLLALPNFFITPHVGTATFETRGAMAALCVRNAVAGLRGEPLPASVPVPV